MKSVNAKLMSATLIAFIPFIITVILSFGVFSQMEDDGVAINLSGSQRMRTMLISNYSLQLHNGENVDQATKLLEANIPAFQNIMITLKDGNEADNISANGDESIVAAITAVQKKTDLYAKSATRILEGNYTDQDIAYITDNCNDIKVEINEIVKMYNSNYDDKVANFKIILIVLIVFGVIIFVLTGLYINKIISKPIKNLTAIIKDISEGDGDLTKRVQIDSRDEIGTMGKYFNNFVESLYKIIESAKVISDDTLKNASAIDSILQELSVSAEDVVNVTADVAEGAANQTEEGSQVLKFVQNSQDEVEQGEINVKEADKMTDETTKAAKVGVEAITKAVEEFESITIAVEFARDSIVKLNLRTAEIGNIVSIISGISSQTNLLALNASIEAARAGEHGRGFAIVAEEVRKLAEETDDATKKISSLITDIQAETSINVNSMNSNVTNVSDQVSIINEGSDALKLIQESVNMSSEKVSELAVNFNNISEGTSNILSSFENMMGVVEVTAGSSQDVAAAVEEQVASIQEVADLMEVLKSNTERLHSEMDRFIL